MMRKRIFSLLLIMICILMIIQPVFAADVGPGTDLLDPMTYLTAPMVPIVVILIGIGAILKKSEFMPDNRIPIVLLAFGILFGVAQTGIAESFTPSTVFTGIIQGLLAALASVGLHQNYKQIVKRE